MIFSSILNVERTHTYNRLSVWRAWDKNTLSESLSGTCQPRPNPVSAILVEARLTLSAVGLDRFIYDMQNILDDLLVVVRISRSKEMISWYFSIYTKWLSEFILTAGGRIAQNTMKDSLKQENQRFEPEWVSFSVL